MVFAISRSPVLIVVAACFLGCAYVYGQENRDAPLLSQVCLGCICEAASGCNVTSGCNGDVCGPFKITWGYWSDAGKPTLNNESSSSPSAYPRCANDVYCAARIVEGYMRKFGQDCNNDGVIDCDDFARIHQLGGYSCSGQLNPAYENTYKLCMKSFS